MNGARDRDQTDSGDEGGLDLREAADLLTQTRRYAERRLDYRSPWLALVGAAVVFVALGAVWLSVRKQHPYTGPTAAALFVMYGVLIAWIVLVVAVTRRASAGVSGRSIRQQRALAAAVVAALVAVSVYQGVLKSDGVSLGTVYGTYPVTSQLIVLGTIGAVSAAWREDWLGLGAAIAYVLVAAGSAFAGPAGVWLSDGIGCAVVALGYGAAQAWIRRR